MDQSILETLTGGELHSSVSFRNFSGHIKQLFKKKFGKKPINQGVSFKLADMAIKSSNKAYGL